MANQTVRIMDEQNGVTRVQAVNGVQMGQDLFVEGVGLGMKHSLISLPEFRIENEESDTATAYHWTDKPQHP